jgi:CheY-like chemotaxis protein
MLSRIGVSAMGQASQPASILLVEDECLISEMIGQALIDRGHSVHSVTTAEAALQYLIDGSPVDLLFTDINLPGDMDGAVLATRARELLPDLPVIYASGRWGMLEQLRAMPRSAVLPKPYSVTRACAAVEELLKPAPARLPELQQAAL